LSTSAGNNSSTWRTYNDKESNFGLLSSPKMSILDSFQALHMGKAAMNRNLIIFPIDVALLLH